MPPFTSSRPPLPFLKWAGGKRWLVAKHPYLFPYSPHHLIEPFCGSSAVFFSLSPNTATLSDSNARLIECYLTIRDDIESFKYFFRIFCQSHSRRFYYDIRQKSFSNPAERAAHFVYLNRVCFNGIYRENLLGQFNVPLGTKPTPRLATDDFSSVSKALQSVQFLHCDFEQTIDKAEFGDFLYVDPPYVTKCNLNGFVKYNQKIFSWADQERLASSVIRAHLRGVSIVLSNADHADLRTLYSTHFNILSLDRATVVASSSNYRGKTTEMVATNVL